MHDPITTETVHGFTVAIHYDEHPMSPREWDNIGRMLCFDRRYSLGDTHGYDHLEEYGAAGCIERIMADTGARVALPLYLLDHSGLSMTAGDPMDLDGEGRVRAFVSDYGGWDTSHVGWIIGGGNAEHGYAGDTDDLTDEQLVAILRAEVAEYDQYLRGEVYGFTVEDRDGEHVESCYGYFTEDEALSEGRATARRLFEHAPQPTLPGMEVYA